MTTDEELDFWRWLETKMPDDITADEVRLKLGIAPQPATVAHVQSVTDAQTAALKWEGRIRTAVAVLLIILGMFGFKVTQTAPTPPEVAAQQVKIVLEQPPVDKPPRTIQDVLKDVEKLTKEVEDLQKKGGK